MYRLKNLTIIFPVLIGLWFADTAISRDRTAGWERNSVLNSMKRWTQRPRAQVAIFGSSTSKDWLDVRTLGQAVGVAPGHVLDAHINGCHQGCTLAEVRLMKTKKRHFKMAFFGTNLFQLCEFSHSKRVLQQEMMLPSTDIPQHFARYLKAEQPLRYIGRFVGIELSGAYADTAYLRSEGGRWLFGRPERGKGHLWARPKPAIAPESVLTCAYSDDDVALKRAYSEALLDDLSTIADQVFLMVLPDRTLGSDDPAIAESWRRHLKLHRELADARPSVTLIDLVTDGARTPHKFRDGFHLNAAGIRDQKRLFGKRMKALGYPKK